MSPVREPEGRRGRSVYLILLAFCVAAFARSKYAARRGSAPTLSGMQQGFMEPKKRPIRLTKDVFQGKSMSVPRRRQSEDDGLVRNAKMVTLIGEDGKLTEIAKRHLSKIDMGQDDEDNDLIPKVDIEGVASFGPNGKVLMAVNGDPRVNDVPITLPEDGDTVERRLKLRLPDLRKLHIEEKNSFIYIKLHRKMKNLHPKKDKAKIQRLKARLEELQKEANQTRIKYYHTHGFSQEDLQHEVFTIQDEQKHAARRRRRMSFQDESSTDTTEEYMEAQRLHAETEARKDEYAARFGYTDKRQFLPFLVRPHERPNETYTRQLRPIIRRGKDGSYFASRKGMKDRLKAELGLPEWSGLEITNVSKKILHRNSTREFAEYVTQLAREGQLTRELRREAKRMGIAIGAPRRQTKSARARTVLEHARKAAMPKTEAEILEDEGYLYAPAPSYNDLNSLQEFAANWHFQPGEAEERDVQRLGGSSLIRERKQATFKTHFPGLDNFDHTLSSNYLDRSMLELASLPPPLSASSPAALLPPAKRGRDAANAADEEGEERTMSLNVEGDGLGAPAIIFPDLEEELQRRQAQPLPPPSLGGGGGRAGKQRDDGEEGGADSSSLDDFDEEEEEDNVIPTVPFLRAYKDGVLHKDELMRPKRVRPLLKGLSAPPLKLDLKRRGEGGGRAEEEEEEELLALRRPREQLLPSKKKKMMMMNLFDGKGKRGGEKEEEEDDEEDSLILQPNLALLNDAAGQRPPESSLQLLGPEEEGGGSRKALELDFEEGEEAEEGGGGGRGRGARETMISVVRKRQGKPKMQQQQQQRQGKKSARARFGGDEDHSEDDNGHQRGRGGLSLAPPPKAKAKAAAPSSSSSSSVEMSEDEEFGGDSEGGDGGGRSSHRPPPPVFKNWEDIERSPDITDSQELETKMGVRTVTDPLTNEEVKTMPLPGWGQSVMDTLSPLERHQRGLQPEQQQQLMLQQRSLMPVLSPPSASSSTGLTKISARNSLAKRRDDYHYDDDDATLGGDGYDVSDAVQREAEEAAWQSYYNLRNRIAAARSSSDVSMQDQRRLIRMDFMWNPRSVGKKVWVYWWDRNRWTPGIISAMDKINKQVHVDYDPKFDPPKDFKVLPISDYDALHLAERHLQRCPFRLRKGDDVAEEDDGFANEADKIRYYKPSQDPDHINIVEAGQTDDIMHPYAQPDEAKTRFAEFHVSELGERGAAVEALSRKLGGYDVDRAKTLGKKDNKALQMKVTKLRRSWESINLIQKVEEQKTDIAAAFRNGTVKRSFVNEKGVPYRWTCPLCSWESLEWAEKCERCDTPWEMIAPRNRSKRGKQRDRRRGIIREEEMDAAMRERLAKQKAEIEGYEYIDPKKRSRERDRGKICAFCAESGHEVARCKAMKSLLTRRYKAEERRFILGSRCKCVLNTTLDMEQIGNRRIKLSCVNCFGARTMDAEFYRRKKAFFHDQFQKFYGLRVNPNGNALIIDTDRKARFIQRNEERRANSTVMYGASPFMGMRQRNSTTGVVRERDLLKAMREEKPQYVKNREAVEWRRLVAARFPPKRPVRFEHRRPTGAGTLYV